MQWQLWWHVLLSRIVVYVASLWHLGILSSYDTSNDNSLYFTNWDGVHYNTIATEQGYPYEHNHAFFPLLPYLLSFFPTIYIPLASTLLSTICFFISAFILYSWSTLFLTKLQCHFTLLFFCLQPANIFMTVAYTESLACCLAFSGCYLLQLHQLESPQALISWKLLSSAMLFGLTSIARSNGILYSLFIASQRLQESPLPWKVPGTFILYWGITAVVGVLAICPQLFYFAFIFIKYCPSSAIAQYVSSELIHTTNIEDRPWCVSWNPTAPYMFIQSEYWNVGFLRYYTLEQIPNFLLALPMILLAGHSIFIYFFGIRWTIQHKSFIQTSVYHCFFLLIYGIFTVHVQILTRLLSACPILYWTPAVYCTNGTGISKYGTAVLVYFFVYNALGTVLFPHFYPWT